MNFIKKYYINDIREAIDKGYDVEIDVWFINDEWFLGHDEPQYEIELNFLVDLEDKIFCHCKNIDALNRMNDNGRIHCFWHQEDDVTLTSKGYMWTYPGKQLSDN